MKTHINLIAISCLVLLIASCSKNDNTVQPQPKILNGNGVLMGSVQLERTSPEDPRSFDQSGVLVEVVGTTLSATTTAQQKAMNSTFTLSGLDSGTYTLRFSKNGYVTREISGIYHNGTDTSTMKYFIADSNGSRTYSIIGMVEQHPEVSAKSIIAELSQKIRIDTIKDHGTIRDIRRDTNYTFISEISLDVNSQFEWSKENYPLAYIAYIDNQTSVISSRLPSKELGDGDMYFTAELSKLRLPSGWFKLDVKPNIASKLSTQDVSSLRKNYGVNLSSKSQLYLHVIPYAIQKGFIVEYKPYDPPLEGSYSTMIQKASITIPIEWK
jgi:hypothetical protein